MDLFSDLVRSKAPSQEKTLVDLGTHLSKMIGFSTTAAASELAKRKKKKRVTMQETAL